jgi:hypothetical protein
MNVGIHPFLVQSNENNNKNIEEGMVYQSLPSSEMFPQIVRNVKDYNAQDVNPMTGG